MNMRWCVKIVAECKDDVLLEAVAIQDAQDRILLFIYLMFETKN